ncbi:MAG: hypothetical protein QNJ14_10375 [Woeseiaceae bacterium]|nr:hypothetical protein [Woeseiaceae bacterium]
MKTRKLILPLAIAGIANLGLAQTAQAGGPLANCADGVPFVWPDGGANIVVNLDQGGLGALTNAEADAFVLAALQTWTDIPSASISYVQGADTPVDYDETNSDPVLVPAAPNGQSEVVYDEDGALFTALFGPDSGILGFAGPDFGNPVTCELLEGSAFLNGPEFEIGDPNNFGAGIIFHEFGHFNNLAHTQTNGAILIGDNTGPSPDDTFGAPDLSIFFDPVTNQPTDALDTMYPFIFSGIDLGSSTPALSDIQSISTLYPEPDYFASTGTITGSVLAPDGVTRVSGVNVIARNVDDPFDDAVSTLSGDRTDILDPTLSPFVGTFEFTGLTPGATYQIYIDEIVDGGFSTPPQQPLLGPEEFFSGAAESNSDDPLGAVGVAVAAGAVSGGVDIIINSPQPGDPLPTGQFGDDFTELFLPFPFEFCGSTYQSVFVNGNGSVSFGAGSTDFSESAGDLLFGPPRIAGFWDDLNSSAAGIVTFDTDGASFFEVIWSEVPEFLATGANSFSIKLLPKKNASSKRGNRFEIEFGDLTATDGLAGYSCGGAVTTGFEAETDFSTLWGRLHGGAALYEEWTDNGAEGESFDLAGQHLRFKGTRAPRDAFEGPAGNNSVADARRIGLPFDSNRRATVLDQAGGDIDFYRFRVKAGDIVAMEVVRGQLDSVLGVFDADTGDLLFIDDDGGDGLLSRAILQFDADLNIAVAATTFPDFGFTGAGGSAGRYVLSVRKYRGEILALGDDDSVEVPLTYGFPFQGEIRNSVFVNSNGNLTFGVGDTDFSESVTDLLNGAPRIATLWDDFDPTGTFGFGNVGLYIVEHDYEITRIHGVSVSEFFSTSPNYFTAEFCKEGDVYLTYGATSRSDALVGISEGGGALDPGETDLSSRGYYDMPSAAGTTYESFPTFPSGVTPFSDFDLYFETVMFEEPDDGDEGEHEE